MNSTLVLNSLAQRGDEVEHLALDRSVESRGRLVEYEQRGVLGQRHGDDHALVHAPRELVRVAPHDARRVGDLHLLEHRPGAVGGLVVGYALDREHLRHLVADVDRRVQRRGRVLVDHRDPVGSQLADVGLAHGQQVLAGHVDRAAAHAAVARQVAQRGERGGRLAAARLPDEPVGLALGDVQGDAAQHPLPVARRPGTRPRAPSSSSAWAVVGGAVALIARTPWRCRRRAGSRR